MRHQNRFQRLLRRAITSDWRQRLQVAISIMIGCTVSYSIIHFFPELWNQYHSNFPFAGIIEPAYVYWNTSRLVKLVSLAFLVVFFSTIYLKFFLPRFLNSVRDRKKWPYLISVILLLVLSCWLVIKMDVSTPPGQKRLEIIPQGKGVSLLEIKIDGEIVDLQSLQKNGGWVQHDQMLVYDGEDYSSLVYTFSNRTNSPLEMIYLKGEECGSVEIKMNGSDKGKFNLTDHVSGERLVEIPIDPRLNIIAFGIIQLFSFSLMFLLLLEIILWVMQYRAIAFSVFYFVIILFIQIINIPENYFYYTGWLIPIYSLARFIFMIYMFAVFYSCGKLIINLLKIPVVFTDSVDSAILYLITGSSVLNILMVLLGFAHGIYPVMGLIITLPLVYLAYEDFLVCLSSIRRKIMSRLRILREWLSGSPISITPEQLLTELFIITAVLEALILLIVHGLSPDLDLHTSNDVARHYIPYYQTIIRNHSLAMNPVWYQVFYSKYNGLYFLSVMLSDKYGAELISFIYSILSALILFSLVNRISKSRFIKWFVLCQYFSIIWSSDVAFSKLHIIEMTALAFCLWVAVKLFYQEPGKTGGFTWICGIGMVGLLFFSPKNMLFVLPFSFIIAIWFYLRKKKEEAKSMLAISGALSIILLAVLVFNYLTTGMFDDQPFKLMWSLADQQKFSQWVSPYVVLHFIEALRFNQSFGGLSINKLQPDWYIRAFHVDKIFFFPYSWYWKTFHWYLFFLIIALLVVAAIIGCKRDKNFTSDKKFIFLASNVVIGIAILLSILLGKWSSLERTFILTVFFMILSFVCLWEMGISLLFQRKNNQSVIMTGFLIIWVLLVFNSKNGFFSYGKQNDRNVISWPNTIATKQVDYLMGRESYAEFTKTDEADLSDYYEAHKFIGEDERIFSINLSFALPGRSIEREIDYAYREWHIMAFEDAEKAKDAFQREGLNYFLISIDPHKQINSGAFPFSPLFHPAHIDDNFDVIWKSDQTYLLTWKGDGINPYPWDDHFLQAYQEKVEKQGLKQIYNRIYDYYLEYGENYPIYIDYSLEPLLGVNKKMQ